MRRAMWWALPLVIACNGGEGDDTSGDDTADTADTSDTGTDTNDTDSGDTGDTDTDSGDTGDTDTDSGDTGDTDTDSGDTADTGTTLPTRFQNHPDTCADFRVLVPGSSEDGHWAGVRLTPPSYPFELTKVRLSMMHDPDGTSNTAGVKCVSNHAYTVKMFITTGTMPPDGTGTAAPTPDDEWTYATAALVGERVLLGEVDPPITLTTGQHVILTVDTNYTSADDKTCILTCNQGTLSDPPRMYWSDAADPKDWAWVTLTPTKTGIVAQGEGYPE